MYIKTKCITSGATDEVRCSLKIIFKQDIVLKRSLALNLHILRTGVFTINLWKLMILNMNDTTVLHIIWAHILGWFDFHEWHHQQCISDPCRSLRGRLCVRAHATAAAVGGQDGTSPRHLPVGGLQPLPHLYRRKGNAIHVYCIQQSCVHME